MKLITFTARLLPIVFVMMLLISTNNPIKASDTIPLNTGLGFSVKIEGVGNDMFINNKTTDGNYGAGTLTAVGFNIGAYYKGFGLNFTIPGASKAKDYYTDNYSEFLGFQGFFYGNWIGVDIYSQTFKGFFVGDDDMLNYRPDWVLADDGFHWAQDMKSMNRSINIYGKILGKRKLSDYFIQPAETRKSKIGLFGLISLDKRSVFDTEGIFMPEAEVDYSEIYNGFEFNQIKANIGIGVTGAVYLRKFYLSSALALGYGMSKVSNDIQGEEFKETVYEFDVLNFKLFTGFQGNKLKVEFGVVYDNDTGNINENYYIQYTSIYSYGKVSIRFQTKK